MNLESIAPPATLTIMANTIGTYNGDSSQDLAALLDNDWTGSALFFLLNVSSRA